MKKTNGNIKVTDGIILAAINGELDQALMQEFKAWLSASEANKTRYEEIKKTWDLSGDIDPAPIDVNASDAWQKVMQQLPLEKDNVIQLNTGWSIQKKVLTIAAALIVLLGSIGVIRFLNDDVESITRFAQASGLQDQLTDGSIVTLNANASLIYPETFEEKERRVELQGEAFFDIERNEEKPFIIDLPEESYVKVLGTSFNIKANEADSITTVYVNTGKVEFGTENEAIILVAGEKGILNRKTGELFKLVGEEAESVVEMYWMNRAIEFDSAPLTDVVGLLNQIFKADVSIDCFSAKMLPTHTAHQDESLEEILNVVAEVHDLKVVHEKGNTYRLKCNED